MDDACYTAELALSNSTDTREEFQVLVKCLEADIFSDTLSSISDEMRKIKFYIFDFIFLFILNLFFNLFF